MAGHVRALAILQIIYASLGLLLGAAVFLLFGGMAALIGLSEGLDESLVAVPILATIGGVAASVIILLVSVPRLLSGIGLWQQRPWGRILTFVVSIIGLIDFPIGTGLGIYGLWVLTRPETAALFADLPAAPGQPLARHP